MLLLLSNSHSSFASPLPGDIFTTTWLLLGMVWKPPFSSVLLLYFPLALIVLPLFFWGTTYNVTVTLCVSGLLWLIVQLFPQLGTVATGFTWLNPLAWQLLFMIGLSVGVQNCALREQPWFKCNQWLVTVAWIVVVLNLVCRFSVFVLTHISSDFGWLLISDDFHLKQTLSPIRLSHFLSIALLFSIYIGPNSPIIQSFAGRFFALTGRHSLELFSFSAVLSTAADVFILTENPSLGGHVIIDCALATIMGLTAIFIAAQKAAQKSL